MPSEHDPQCIGWNEQEERQRVRRQSWGPPVEGSIPWTAGLTDDEIGRALRIAEYLSDTPSGFSSSPDPYGKFE